MRPKDVFFARKTTFFRSENVDFSLSRDRKVFGDPNFRGHESSSQHLRSITQDIPSAMVCVLELETARKSGKKGDKREGLSQGVRQLSLRGKQKQKQKKHPLYPPLPALGPPPPLQKRAALPWTCCCEGLCWFGAYCCCCCWR